MSRARMRTVVSKARSHYQLVAARCHCHAQPAFAEQIPREVERHPSQALAGCPRWLPSSRLPTVSTPRPPRHPPAAAAPAGVAPGHSRAALPRPPTAPAACALRGWRRPDSGPRSTPSTRRPRSPGAARATRRAARREASHSPRGSSCASSARRRVVKACGTA